MNMLSHPIGGRCFGNALLEVPRFGMCLHPSRSDPAEGLGTGLGNTTRAQTQPKPVPKTGSLCHEQTQPAQESAPTMAPRSEFICSYTLVCLFLQLIFFCIIVENSFKLNSEVNLCIHVCRYNLLYQMYWAVGLKLM